MKLLITICMLLLTVTVRGQSVTAVADVARELLHIVEPNPAEKEMSDSINGMLDGAIDAFLSGAVPANEEKEAYISALLRESDVELYSDTQEARRMEQRRMNCHLVLALLSDGKKREMWMKRAERGKGKDKELSGAYMGVMFVRLLFLLKGNDRNTESLLREIERYMRDNKTYIPEQLANRCREIIKVREDDNKNDSIMIQPYGEKEKYDFKITEGGTKATSFMRGQTLVDIYGMILGEGVYKEYAPACDFYMTYKAFHPNGMLKEKGCYYFNSIKFGEWKYYNENGDLIETVNEDLKFGKIKPQDIILLLEKEGWFNRKTGANKLLDTPEYILNSDSACAVINPPNFRTDGYFTYEMNRWMDISFDSSNGHPQWFVSIDPTAINNWTWTTYTIDGDTGKFEKDVKYVEPPKE